MFEAERALVAAVLGEATPLESAERMCAAFSRIAGVNCVLLEGHQPRRRDALPGQAVHLLLGDTTDETARTLVVTGADVFEPEELDRVKRLFEKLIEVAYPIRRRGRTIHQLNNGLAALAANIELVELLITDAGPHPLDEPAREDLSKAVQYAVESCRAVRKTVRSLAGLSGTCGTPQQARPDREPATARASAGPDVESDATDGGVAEMSGRP